jgi:glycosyltransferase involved in cell wall biosynthesis
MSYAPLVSCIMPTRGRRGFLAQAVRCFQHQSYPHRELIIADDGPEPQPCELDALPDVRYLRFADPLPLGVKLNLAIAQARGSVIQKLDDDDYYAPGFLERTVLGLADQDPDSAIVAMDCFLVLIAATGHLTFSGHGWLAGNSLCFHRKLWEQRKFRDVATAEDWWFLRDHPRNHVRVCEPELAIVVRHDFGHAWIGRGSRSVTDRFAARPAWPRPLSELVTTDALRFYEGLRTRR